MRDYVDPWAHNGANNSGQMGGPMGGNFGMGNGGLNSIGGLNSLGSLGNNSNNQNNGGFGNNMDMDGKTSTQVTIPKDVSFTYFMLSFSFD